MSAAENSPQSILTIAVKPVATGVDIGIVQRTDLGNWEIPTWGGLQYSVMMGLVRMSGWCP